MPIGSILAYWQCIFSFLCDPKRLPLNEDCECDQRFLLVMQYGTVECVNNSSLGIGEGV